MKVYAPSRISRRHGERFFFKAIRDASPKSAMVKRPYPPGMHGKRRPRGGRSEFAIELGEKQKIRFTYGITNRVLKKYVDTAARIANKGKTKTAALIELLERRLDNVVFRLGLAPSRRIARHLVSYGHITVNGRMAKTPSIRIKPGDIIGIREGSRSLPLFESLAVRLKKYEAPAWLTLDPEGAKGTVTRVPSFDDNLTTYDLSKIIEFYSR